MGECVSILNGYEVKDKTAREQIDNMQKIVPLACFVTVEDGVWKLLDDEGHTPINVTGVANNGGVLTIYHTPTAKVVGGLTITPNHKYLEQGIFAGASVGVTFSNIEFKRNLTAGGLFMLQGGAITAVQGYCNLIESVEWNAATTAFEITIGTWMNPYPTAVNVSFLTEGRFSVCGCGSGRSIQVKVYDKDGNLITDPEVAGGFWLNVSYDQKLSASDLAEYTSYPCGFWVNGFMINE